MDIIIPWKKITRRIPKGRKYANDGATTIEEIRRMLEFLTEESNQLSIQWLDQE